MTQPNSNPFQGFRFARGRSRFPQRLIPLAVAAVVFTGIWWLLPSGVAFWLLLPIVITLTWAASYQWRQAVAALITLLHRLEEA